MRRNWCQEMIVSVPGLANVQPHPSRGGGGGGCGYTSAIPGSQIVGMTSVIWGRGGERTENQFCGE